MSSKPESVVCGVTILGPRMGRNVVLWRKQCKRKTRHESGRCPAHRTSDRFAKFGPGASR